MAMSLSMQGLPTIRARHIVFIEQLPPARPAKPSWRAIAAALGPRDLDWSSYFVPIMRYECDSTFPMLAVLGER